MKTIFLITIALVTALVFSSENALAARKITTVQGVLGESSQGKKMLKTSGDNGYYFDQASEAGKKILATCQQGKVCIVRGVINGSHILNAYYVKMTE